MEIIGYDSEVEKWVTIFDDGAVQGSTQYYFSSKEIEVI